MFDPLDKFGKIHYTQLIEVPPGNPLHKEANFMLRELPRLLAEGYDGKWALVKGEDVIGFFETFDDAYREGFERYLRQPFLVQPIREWQPFVRTCR